MFPTMSDERTGLLTHHRASPAYTASLPSPRRDVAVDIDERRHHAAIPSAFQASDAEAALPPLPPLPPPPPPPSSLDAASALPCGCCGRCVLSVSRVLGAPLFIFYLVLVYLLSHWSLCLWTLVTYWQESCTYEYHYLLIVWMIRDALGLRILHWQTHAGATEPSTFDRFLKNWMDMIALIYAGMWALVPRDCMALAPHHFWVSTVLVCLSYSSLLLRGLLYLAMTHLRPYLGDVSFVLARSLSKCLNGGAAFTGQLLRGSDVLVISEMEGVSVVRFERGMWDEEDALCVICLCAYAPGEEIRVLGCGHHLHTRCGDQWLLTARKCPMCMQSV